MKLLFKGQIIYCTGIHFDSRQVKKGYLFVAVVGTLIDGHSFIQEAINNGAKVIVCQVLPTKLCHRIKYIQVKDSAKELGNLAALYNENPSKRLQLIGVTGTNGKTTIAISLYKLFKKLGYKVGLISTICNSIDNLTSTAVCTTPDIITLNNLLSKMVSDGCQYVFMEISSHAIDQKRIFGLQFKGAIFTNLSRDHLDYHKTFAAYRDTKKTFFDSLSINAFALTNKDDKNGMFMLQNTKAKKYTYSIRSLSDFKGCILELHLDGTLMEINKKELFTLFVGKFNAYNLLAIYGASVLLGECPDTIRIGLSNLSPAPGRFEVFRVCDYTVVLDYAHTPDALKNVLNTIWSIHKKKGKIITVIGCGGNRDKGKRPLMAKEVLLMSQQVLFTSDNPRFEDPKSILEDMISGLGQLQLKKTLCIVNRKEAIYKACSLARPKDIVLIAGKGHESYQEICGVKYPFSDRDIIMKIIKMKLINT